MTLVEKQYINKKYDSNLSIINTALAKVKDKKIITGLFFLKGSSELLTGQYIESEKSILLAINQSGKSENYRPFITNSYAELAFLCYARGDYLKGIQYADTGLIFARKDERNYYRLINEKARCLKELGRYEEAKKLLVHSLELVKEEKEDLCIYLKVLSQCYQGLGESSKAIQTLKKAFYLSKKYSLKEEIPSISVTLGYLYYLVANYDSSLYFSHYALVNKPTMYTTVRVLDNMGAAYWKKQNYLKALSYYQKALQTIPIQFTDNRLGSNPPARSIQLIAKKEYLLTILEDKSITWLDYYYHTHNKSHLSKALECYMVADSMVDYMRWQHSNEQSKLFWRNRTHFLYNNAIEICHLLGDAKHAFYFFEKSRSILLADRLNELSASQRLSPKDAEEEQQFRQQIEQAQVSLGSSKGEAYDLLVNRLDSLTQAQQAFIQSLEKTNPTYYRYKYDNYLPSLQRVQESLLKPDQAFISYFVGDSTLYALAITQNHTIFKKLSLEAYQDKAKEYLQLCARPLTTLPEVKHFYDVGYQLYQILLKPLGINHSRIIISSDGVFLPYESLSLSPNKPDFLIRKQAFSYTYSAGFLLRERNTSGWSKNFLGIAPEQFAPSLNQQSLPGSVEALTALEEYITLPKHLTRKQATKRAFLNQASDYRILQLFTHADADSSNAYEPVLYFSDSTLNLSELDATRSFHTQLLVLSACKTGVGSEQKGEGILSLARGFAALGIPSIITTLWSVKDQATYELSKSFYHYLANGLSQDVALQRAKIDWLEKYPTSLPYDWAGLILIGETKPIRTSPPLLLYAGLFIGIASLLAGLGYWYKRLKSAPHPQSLGTNGPL
ncbi:MAG: CHAT domain-containing protein [Siphonobacter sp.]